MTAKKKRMKWKQFSLDIKKMNQERNHLKNKPEIKYKTIVSPKYWLELLMCQKCSKRLFCEKF